MISVYLKSLSSRKLCKDSLRHWLDFFVRLVRSVTWKERKENKAKKKKKRKQCAFGYPRKIALPTKEIIIILQLSMIIGLAETKCGLSLLNCILLNFLFLSFYHYQALLPHKLELVIYKTSLCMILKTIIFY